MATPKSKKKTKASKKKKTVKKTSQKVAKKTSKKASKKAARTAKPSKKKPAKKTKASSLSKKKSVKKAAPKRATKKSSQTPRSGAQVKTSSKVKWNEFFTPLDDRLVVLIEGPSEKTAGGIIIPGSVSERPNQGQVLVTGRGKKDQKGRIRPMDVKAGETVVFGTYSGMKMTLNNQEVLMLREEDILGVMQK